MGRTPPSGSGLAQLLRAQRAAALSSLDFFARVAPLARRLGMSDFPAFETFSCRFHDTEDINTDQLRADGEILKQLSTTAAAQVDHQREQDAPLVSCWPDGSGIVARQQLLVHLPRADTDVTMLGDVATGLLVAADCIEVSRLAKFTAIATIEPNTLVGMPIGHWLSHQATSVFANGVALRAAITASVNLFWSAVNTCDQAIEATLSGVCSALGGMDTFEYPVGGGAECPAPKSPGPAVGATAPAGPQVPCDAPGGSSGNATSSASTPSTSSGTAAPAAVAPNPGPAAVVAAGAGTSTTALGQTSSSATGEVGAQLAGLLGPVIGVVGQAVATVVSGVVEAVVTAGAHAQAASTPGADVPDGTAPGPASITLGDKTIEVKAGSDGTSVSLTVREPAPVPDIHTLDVRADGSVELRGAAAPDEEPSAEEPPAPAEAPVRTSSGGPSASEDQTAPAPVAEAEPTDAVNCPPPAAVAPGGKQSSSFPHPAGSPPNDRGAQVAPQSSVPEEWPPPDDGVLALAGEQ